MLHELDPSHVVISQVMLLHQSEAVYVNNQIIAVEILDLLNLMVACKGGGGESGFYQYINI